MVEGLDYGELGPGLDEDEQATGIRRIARIVLGVILVIAGIAMLVLPGQGILTILIGLNLIKPDNPLVHAIRKRTPGIPDEGPIPTGVVVGGVVLFVALGVASFFLGPAFYDWATGLF